MPTEKQVVQIQKVCYDVMRILFMEVYYEKVFERI